MADPGRDLRPVLLDRLAGAATVAALAPGEVHGDRVGGQGQPGRDPLDDDPERAAVRLPGGQEAEPSHRLADGRRAGRLALGRLDARRPGPPAAWPA